jgi:hypothetical protein
MTPRMPSAAFAVALIAVVTAPLTAHADPPVAPVAAPVAAPAAAPSGPLAYLSPGLLYSDVWGRSPAHGFGFELSYAWRPSNTSRLTLGGFTQGQWYTDGSLRGAAGVEAGWRIFGLELGVAHRTGTDAFAATTSLHVAPYISLGVASVAVRFSVPLYEATAAGPNAGPTQGQGFETALTFALKFPIRVAGTPQWHGCGCSRGR